jgi:DNA-binding IclR family transcriptional regulator
MRNSVPTYGMTDRPTSVDKALDLVERLSEKPEGLTLRELAASAGLPPPTAHRLLALLRRRDYVRQDVETGRYALTLKVLDLSFRQLNRSELRLHAYPALRVYTNRSAGRAFLAAPDSGEVTYVWSGQDEGPATYTAYGKPMPGHCAMFFAHGQARRLSCARLCTRGDVLRSRDVVTRFGDVEGSEGAGMRLNCACAPVCDHSGQEVARVGVFSHAQQETPVHDEHVQAAWTLAEATSRRLGHLPETGSSGLFSI